MRKRHYVCDTCIKNGKGEVMSEADARLHQDRNLTHAVIPADSEPIAPDSETL